MSTLSAGLLGITLVGKGVLQDSEGTIRAGKENKQSCSEFLMQPHLLINFEIQKYYQNKPRINGVYSRNNLPKIKDGAINK